MSTQYPNNADQFPVHQDNNNETISAATINNLQDAVVAIENTVGTSLPNASPVRDNLGNLRGNGLTTNGSKATITQLSFPTGLAVANTASGAVGANIVASTQYTYSLTGVAYDGSETNASAGVSVTTGTTAYPINLTWTAVTGNGYQYINIYKGGKFLAQVASNTTSYTDSGNTATTTQSPPSTNNTGQLVAGGVSASTTGATAASRYVGATTSGAPASGSFLLGDYVVDQSGKIWVCTTAGSPGTWTQIGGSGGGFNVNTVNSWIG